MMDLALNIARAGLRVVLTHTVGDDGLCTCGRKDKCPEKTRGKHPIATAWQKIATDDEQALRDQSSRLRFDPNISIALGPQSDGRYIVSIDDDDAARMAELEELLGELPHTMSGQSPRGAHLFFALAADTPLDRVKNVTGITLAAERAALPTDQKAVPGVDMKAAGGQVVVAGRNAGGEYTGFDLSVAIAELPAAWTLAILTPVPLPKTAREYTPQTLREDGKAKRRHETYLDRAIASECRIVARTGEGQRNTAVYTAACRLFPVASGLHLAAGISLVRDEVARAGVAAGLSVAEASAAVASAEKWVVDNGIVRMPREVPRESPAPSVRPAPDQTSAAGSANLSIDLIEDNGSPAKIAENVARMLAIHPRGAPRMNILANRAEWPAASGKPGDPGERITDVDEVRIQGWLVEQPASLRVRVGIDAVHAGILVCAESRAFHPVREYLSALTWDGVERIEDFARDCLGAADGDLARGYMRCFFIGSVARAMVPGCQLDTVLVLEGAQGARKTSALRTLFGEKWFGNTPINVRKTPDCYQAIDGFWGYELGEMDAHAREAAVMKAFVSMREDTYRPSYGRNTVTRVRQVAFTATTNAETYLADETGARRWQCLKCGTVDLARVARDRDQLWAEAAHRWAKGEPWWLDDTLAMEAANDVDSRYQGDPWDTQLPGLLAEHHSVTTSAALLLLGVEIGKQSRADEMRIGAVLRRMSWTRRRVMHSGIRAYEYAKTLSQAGQQ